VATGSGQPAAAFAATVPAIRTRVSWRSHGNGMPIQVSTMSSSAVPIRPPSIPTGTNRGSGIPRAAASAATDAYDPAAP
jgi:hypothetical protein